MRSLPAATRTPFARSTSTASSGARSVPVRGRLCSSGPTPTWRPSSHGTLAGKRSRQPPVAPSASPGKPAQPIPTRTLETKADPSTLCAPDSEFAGRGRFRSDLPADLVTPGVIARLELQRRVLHTMTLAQPLLRLVQHSV